MEKRVIHKKAEKILKREEKDIVMSLKNAMKVHLNIRPTSALIGYKRDESMIIEVPKEVVPEEEKTEFQSKLIDSRNYFFAGRKMTMTAMTFNRPMAADDEKIPGIRYEYIISNMKVHRPPTKKDMPEIDRPSFVLKEKF